MLLSFSKEIIFIKQKLFGKVIKEERKKRRRRGVGKVGEGRPRYEERRESLNIGRVTKNVQRCWYNNRVKNS